MKFEMATLHSAFAARRLVLAFAFRTPASEWQRRVKKWFCDVSRQYRATVVAKRRQSCTALLMLTLGLAGCAGTGALSDASSAEARRDAVAERAKARWERLIAGDLDGAYAFLSPASQKTMPLDLYKAKHKVGMYRGVKVDDVKCDGDTCTVKLLVTYDYKRFRNVTTPLTETWIITQGQAWFVDRG
jgi:putative sterol carrier protein